MSTPQLHMQDWSLTLDRILEHAQRWHGDREIVTRSIEGPITRCGYADIHRRARQMSNALLDLGIRPGERVATLAFNTSRHLEAWYGIMGIGAVCHTLNPRLFIEQLVYIVNHAQDQVLLADTVCVPLLRAEWTAATDDATGLPIELTVLAYDRRGLVRDLSEAIAAQDVAIESLHTAAERRDGTSRTTTRLRVRDLGQMTRLLRQLAAVAGVISARRSA